MQFYFRFLCYVKYDVIFKKNISKKWNKPLCTKLSKSTEWKHYKQI